MSALNRSSRSALAYFEPTWVVVLMAVVIGLILSVGIVAAFNYSNSLHQQLMAIQSPVHAQPQLTQVGEAPPTESNSILSNVPLLLFYGFIGLVVYIIAVSIVKSLQSVSELRQEMNYVNARPAALRKAFLGNLGVRLGALVGWLLFSEVFVKLVIPYAVVADQAATTEVISLSGLSDIAVAFLIVAVSIYVNAVFVRLVAVRPRIFS
jgi:hypothetical protein